jgi:hypothetical protein
MTNGSNGRVQINYPSTTSLFNLFDKMPAHQCTTFRKPISTQVETVLHTAFFSKENVLMINNAIRKGVYQNTNNQYLISNQDFSVITIIMKSIFLSHSKNNSTNITEQIKQLNNLVIDYSISRIINEAKSYIKYIKDVSELPTPLDYPKMTNTKHNQLERKILF